MEVPDLVDSHLEGERVVRTVDLDGDAVFVTPTRTLVYRREGLLSDESVSEFSHDVDRLELREGRRKATLRLIDIDGSNEFSVPASRIDDVLAPVLWGMLRADGVLDSGERIVDTYRFSELTLVVTDSRILKHVGAALWDQEFEEFPYADLTDLDFEEGSVATSVVLEVGGRRERVKTPNDEARFVRRSVEEAVFDFHDVESLSALRAKVRPAEDEDGVTDAEGAASPTGSGGSRETDAMSMVGTDFEPLTGGSGDADATDAADAADAASGVFEEWGTSAVSGEADERVREGESGSRSLEASDVEERSDRGEEPDAIEGPDAGQASGTSPGSDAKGSNEVTERLADLESAVRRQNELLEKQRVAIERLVEELERGR